MAPPGRGVQAVEEPAEKTKLAATSPVRARLIRLNAATLCCALGPVYVSTELQ
jgi:hypothetical protein